MNFSQFEYLKNDCDYLADCVECCKKAERNARTNPAETAAKARLALEYLLRKLSKDHGLKPGNLSESIRQNFDYLKDSISKNAEFARQILNDAQKLEEDVEQTRSKAEQIRKYGNDAVHGNKTIDAANKKNITQAMSIVRDLYDLLCAFYGKPADFNDEQVPFGPYRILRKILNPEELNRDCYFVCTSDKYPRYYYLQCLSFSEELDLEARREEASELVYDNLPPDCRLAIPDLSLDLSEGSDRKIVLYLAKKDSKLLSELTEKLKLKQALEIGLEMICGLKNMKELGMYHRNIFPGCVLVNYDTRNQKYTAQLMNLQTSKILDSGQTVNHRLASAWDRNYYIPSVMHGREATNPNWEKVDVYALCMVVLYCMNPELVLNTSTANLANTLGDDLSDPLRELYKRLFRADPALARVPTLEKLEEIFIHEYKNCL